jgi:pimeloyl-[acyl-carrier protein] methyl ester esterase
MTKIHQETFGEGKSIVLVHGWAMHSGIWRGFAEQLAQHYRVTLIDLPGHGHSGRIDPFTLARISTEIIQVVQVESSCWLGWSLGATVVLDIAARYPDRVSSLVILAGNPFFSNYSIASRSLESTDWPGMSVQLLDDFADQLNNNCQATLLRFLSLQVKGLPDHKAFLNALKTTLFECDAPDAHTLQGGLQILKQSDLRPVLSQLMIPVSVILGGLDTLVPATVGQKMQQLLPTLELNIIDRAGHVPFLSHSRETLAIISRFMDERCS